MKRSHLHKMILAVVTFLFTQTGFAYDYDQREVLDISHVVMKTARDLDFALDEAPVARTRNVDRYLLQLVTTTKGLQEAVSVYDDESVYEQLDTIKALDLKIQAELRVLARFERPSYMVTKYTRLLKAAIYALHKSVTGEDSRIITN